jgi:hypothetical protein
MSSQEKHQTILIPSLVSSLVDPPNNMQISKGKISFSTHVETKHEKHRTW